MPDSLHTLVQTPLLGGQYPLTVLAILCGLAALLYLVRTPLRRWRQERQIAGAIKRLGARVLHDVRLPDGMGGKLVIEHLLLATDAILVVDVKRFAGLIFGSAQTDQWTQVVNTRSYRFPNPDNYLQLQVIAVRTVVPKVPVKGLHVFTHGAVFPRDKPANVLLLEDIRKIPRRPKMKDIPKELDTAWNTLADSVS